VTKRRVREDEKCLAVRIRQISTPDSERRLSHAIEVLLRLVAGEPEGSVSAKKEEKPPKDSRHERIAGQSDGEKG
jgi:hypothetical protein